MLAKQAYSTVYSQAVTHPSTNTAQCYLTSVIGRELVCSTWYGRRQPDGGNFGKTTNRLKVESKNCDVGSREHFLPTKIWTQLQKRFVERPEWIQKVTNCVQYRNFEFCFIAARYSISVGSKQKGKVLAVAPVQNTIFDKTAKRTREILKCPPASRVSKWSTLCWLVGKWADHGGTAMPSQPVKKPEQPPELSPLTKISLISKEAHGHRIRY